MPTARRSGTFNVQRGKSPARCYSTFLRRPTRDNRTRSPDRPLRRSCCAGQIPGPDSATGPVRVFCRRLLCAKTGTVLLVQADFDQAGTAASHKDAIAAQFLGDAMAHRIHCSPSPDGRRAGPRHRALASPLRIRNTCERQHAEQAPGAEEAAQHGHQAPATRSRRCRICLRLSVRFGHVVSLHFVQRRSAAQGHFSL